MRAKKSASEQDEVEYDFTPNHEGEENRGSKGKPSKRKRERELGTEGSAVTQQVRVKSKPNQGGWLDKIVSFFRLVLILAVILFCVLVVAGIWGGGRITQMAAEKFGPPDPGLSTPQRVLYSARLLLNERSLTTAEDPQGKARSFDVPLGETVNSIATRLEEERLITNADAFRTYLIYAGLDKGVQAGSYQLSPSMTIVQIARALQNPVPTEVKFNILPGWRAEEIAAALPTSGLDVGQYEFLEIVRNPPADLLPTGFPPLDSLEGFMMPGQYQIKRDISPHDLAALFVKRFDQTVTPDLRDAYDNQKLSLAQAVTLASMVQREAVVTNEQPTIASVFYNRLADGMKLDSDPTVQFALGYDEGKHTWWKNPLTQTDLQVDSRYNTYIYPGLPPGPIDSPGIDALRAVATPAHTDFYYFRAKCDGSGRHAFSKTYEEHLQNACP